MRTFADIYSPSGHFGASLSKGEVTVTVRNAVGDHASVNISLHLWCQMIEKSRETARQADYEPEEH